MNASRLSRELSTPALCPRLSQPSTMSMRSTTSSRTCCIVLMSSFVSLSVSLALRKLIAFRSNRHGQSQASRTCVTLPLLAPPVLPSLRFLPPFAQYLDTKMFAFLKVCRLLLLVDQTLMYSTCPRRCCLACWLALCHLARLHVRPEFLLTSFVLS